MTPASSYYGTTSLSGRSFLSRQHVRIALIGTFVFLACIVFRDPGLLFKEGPSVAEQVNACADGQPCHVVAWPVAAHIGVDVNPDRLHRHFLVP